MGMSWQIRIVVIATAIAICMTAPSKNVVFHNSIPSNLFVNVAHGPIHIKDDPNGDTEVIHLLLYPADKKSRAPKTARVMVDSGGVLGSVTLRQDNPPTGPVFIAGFLKGLTPGKHGIKIFEFGDIEDQCASAGKVYNPYSVQATPTLSNRETGNLGLIHADENGKAEIALSDPFITLVGPRSVVGRSFVLTNFPEGTQTPSEEVKEACGVVGFAS